jgi:GTP-binding protein
MLTNKKHLAKTSGTPGKTQLINHFVVNAPQAPWFLVDLPGYGYAKAPKRMSEKWMNFSKFYLRSRPNLMCVMVLLDCRLEPQDVDLDFMDWLGSEQIPFVMVFTKIDKLKPGVWEKNFAVYSRKMLETWEELPQVFATSAEGKQGKQEVLDFIGGVNATYADQA